jgi:hypothetical protein
MQQIKMNGGHFMRARILMITAVLLATGVSAQANTVCWGAYSGEWTNQFMWWDRDAKVNRVPDIADTALFYTDAIATVGAGHSVTVKMLYLGEWCQSGLPHNSVSPLVLNGSLTAKVYSSIGCQSGGTPTMKGHLIINEGGNFTEEQGLMVGLGNTGTITMNGGTLNATWWLGLGCTPWSNDDSSTPGIGVVNLNGGTIQTNALFMGSDASKIIVKDGALQSNIVTRIPMYLDNNQIIAAEGYTLNVDYTFNKGFGVRITATGPMKGDMDGNKKVNFKDFAIFAKSWADGI